VSTKNGSTAGAVILSMVQWSRFLTIFRWSVWTNRFVEAGDDLVPFIQRLTTNGQRWASGVESASVDELSLADSIDMSDRFVGVGHQRYGFASFPRRGPGIDDV
jgi:hypothetical protein